MEECFDKRRAGILLHISSLPGKLSAGCFSHAKKFIKFLSNSGMSVWQMLPMCPIHNDGSPYQNLSAFAGNPDFISSQFLYKKGWLMQNPDDDTSHLYLGAKKYREELLASAFLNFKQQLETVCALMTQYNEFLDNQKYWLNDYALFMALRKRCPNQYWTEWPVAFRDRYPDALKQAADELSEEIQKIYFEQFCFLIEWEEIKLFAKQQGVLLFGDIPLYVAHDSADVWVHRNYFCLDEKGKPTLVSGVPPDYFSNTGQRWGHPQYHWDALQSDGFEWWLQRFRHHLNCFDLLRIDHFRGLESYWAIPADSTTAEQGSWVSAPGAELLNALKNEFKKLPLVAEDLGIITDEVRALRDKFNLPGMSILQFAFDEQNSAYLPENHIINSVAYTGTHDNNTSLAWYQSLTDPQKENVDARLKSYLQKFSCPNQLYSETMPWPMIKCVLASKAKIAIIPMQDILALDEEHRMNTPGTIGNNWRWRFDWEQISDSLPTQLHALNSCYQRCAEQLHGG